MFWTASSRMSVIMLFPFFLPCMCDFKPPRQIQGQTRHEWKNRAHGWAEGESAFMSFSVSSQFVHAMNACSWKETMSTIHTWACVLLWISLATQKQTPGRTQTSLCPADPADPSAGKCSQSFKTQSFLLRTWSPLKNKITWNLKLKLARMFLAFKKMNYFILVKWNFFLFSFTSGRKNNGFIDTCVRVLRSAPGEVRHTKQWKTFTETKNMKCS